jgi:hypothetical protein
MPIEASRRRSASGPVLQHQGCRQVGEVKRPARLDIAAMWSSL